MDAVLSLCISISLHSFHAEYCQCGLYWRYWHSTGRLEKVKSFTVVVDVGIIMSIIITCRVSILTEAQVSETIKVVISRLTTTKCDRTKKALLVTLGRLPVGVVTDGIVVTILPHLVDPNVSKPSQILIYRLVYIIIQIDVRNSAFNALKTIADITNR